MTSDEQKKFITKVAKALKDIETDIDKAVILAQTIQESGWGTSELVANANNYVGLNWYNNDPFCLVNSKYEMKTQQERDGKLVNTVEWFQKFKSLKECLRALVRWYDRSKYKPIHGADYKTTANYLTGKYATDSKYGERLIAIIEKYKLTSYVATNKPTSSFQFGAFVVKTYADMLAERLKLEGVDAQLIKANGFYKVIAQTDSAKASELSAMGYTNFKIKENVNYET